MQIRLMKLPRFCFALFSLFGLLFINPASAQEVHENVAIELVNVYLTATDHSGRFITDLKPEELTLLEDGKVQNISNFTNFAQVESDKLGEKGVPLTVAFVIDTSESMGEAISGEEKIDIVKNAAYRLEGELRDEDQMTLISFNDTPSEITSMTSEKKKFEKDLLFLSVQRGNTALLDSIYFAMEKLKDKFGRKIIVVCSDGEDTASYLRFDEVLSNVIASDITILAFGTMALGSNSIRGRYILEKLAQASGGYAFFPTSLDALNQAMEKLRQGMRSQYSLGYRPQRAMDGKWRKIEVTCKKPGIKLRYREGYLAK